MAINKRFASEEYVQEQVKIIANPPPSVMPYTKPTKIPIQSGTQLVFYGSSAGTMEFKMGSQTYSHDLVDAKDCGWVLWVQSTDIDGSIISQSGRTYLNLGEVIKEIDVTWTPTVQTDKPNWIVITIN